ncbi:MAG: hypothetical protein ACNYNX_12365 [Leucobacter sp.]
MPHSKNSKLVITLQTVAIVIAVFLTVMVVLDLVNGQHSPSVWIGLVCWPVVAILGVVQIVQVRKRV